MRRRKRPETKWKLTRRKGRAYWVCRYMLAGKSRWREESTGCRRKREAEIAARKIVALAEETGDRELYGWAEFRKRYDAEHLTGLGVRTRTAFSTAANRLEQLCRVESIDELDANAFSRFALRLREEGKSEATIQAYRDHLMAALAWAKKVDLIGSVPNPPALHRVPTGTKSRGRALSREEAERIALALPKIVGDAYAKRWAWNLEALWRSGFRIAETFVFHWEPSPGCHYVDRLDERRPRIVIDAEAEKGFTNRTIPMAPDFVALLRNVPRKQRRGPVFRWTLSRGDSISEKTVSKRISAAGKKADVITRHLADGEFQHATAHDFRRSFGARWAPKVMPLILKELMRHHSIETTLKYYVGENADRTADTLWNVEGAVLGDMLDSLFAVNQQNEPENAAKHG